MERSERALGSLLGLMIGDALAMPVHWYYNTQALEADYGRVVDFQSPRNPHPDSILWRSRYRPLNPDADILHEQAQYWGRRGVHYHQFLQAGENTLNLQLCLELLDSLAENQGYDQADYVRRYVAFMTEPGRHRDTYVEEVHRHFFENRARGAAVDRCGVKEKHIGGLVNVVPIIAWYAEDPETGGRPALDHLALTHKGPLMEEAARLVIRLLAAVYEGNPLDDAIRVAIERQDSPFLGFPFERWLSLPDDEVIGRQVSPACYVQDALPAVIHLALKYSGRPEEALIANTNLGGDNAHRGAVLGALLGADQGQEGFPERWACGLRCRDRLVNTMKEKQDEPVVR